MVHAERYVCELCHVYENGAADLFFFSVVLHFQDITTDCLHQRSVLYQRVSVLKGERVY